MQLVPVLAGVSGKLCVSCGEGGQEVAVVGGVCGCVLSGNGQAGAASGRPLLAPCHTAVPGSAWHVAGP